MAKFNIINWFGGLGANATKNNLLASKKRTGAGLRAIFSSSRSAKHQDKFFKKDGIVSNLENVKTIAGTSASTYTSIASLQATKFARKMNRIKLNKSDQG